MRKPLILPGGWEEVVVRESPLGCLSQAVKDSHKFAKRRNGQSCFEQKHRDVRIYSEKGESTGNRGGP